MAAGTAPASAASAFTSTVVNQGSSAYGRVSTGEDDFQAPENYPIVSLHDSAGDVYSPREV